MSKPYGYVYMTHDITEDKFYFGQHKGEFDPSYFGSGNIIRRILKKYPKGRLKVTLCRYAKTKEELNEFEKWHVWYYKQAIGSFNLYNMTDGGDGGCTTVGRKWMYNRNTKELRKLTEEDANCYLSKNEGWELGRGPEFVSKFTTLDQSGSNNGMYGKKQTDRAKKLISKSSSKLWALHDHETCTCFSCKSWRGERKNKTYEEIYGKDKAEEVKSSISIGLKSCGRDYFGENNPHYKNGNYSGTHYCVGGCGKVVYKLGVKCRKCSALETATRTFFCLDGCGQQVTEPNRRCRSCSKLKKNMNKYKKEP